VLTVVYVVLDNVRQGLIRGPVSPFWRDQENVRTYR
jgi:hypothetical protein